MKETKRSLDGNFDEEKTKRYNGKIVENRWIFWTREKQESNLTEWIASSVFFLLNLEFRSERINEKLNNAQHRSPSKAAAKQHN